MGCVCPATHTGLVGIPLPAMRCLCPTWCCPTIALCSLWAVWPQAWQIPCTVFFNKFLRYYARGDAENAMRYINGTRLDDRIIRTDWDAGFKEGRQYGRGRSGGQVGCLLCEGLEAVSVCCFLNEHTQNNLRNSNFRGVEDHSIH